VTRLPPVRPTDLDDDGRALWDRLIETRGAALQGPDGALIGPFNAFVTAPTVGARLAELGGILRFETSVDRRLLEVAIITTGARWRSEFEFWAHARMAREHGVAKEVVDAIAAGDPSPPFDHDGDRVVHAVATQLGATGRIDDDTYAAARALLGDRGLVEIVALCGYYTLISFTLNAFDVRLPEGATPRWG
jgi:4-carboxymuconolactone decarboxylase